MVISMMKGSNMVKLIPAICPQCGGELEVPEHLEKAHCVYCGTKIIIEKKVGKHVHYHVRQAVFTCEVCMKKKTLREFSGVDGRSLCMSCYDKARNKGFTMWIAGFLLILLGLIPFTSRDDFLRLLGAVILFLGFGSIVFGRMVAKGWW